MTPETLYSQAALLAANPGLAATLDGLKQLCTGWNESISPAPVHKLLSEKLAVPEGRAHHRALWLQLAKVGTVEEKLTVGHARLWQFLSLRFFPANPAGLMQFQMELAVILEELAREQPAEYSAVPLPESPQCEHGNQQRWCNLARTDGKICADVLVQRG